MSKIHDPLSAASAEMLTAAASLVRELVESAHKDLTSQCMLPEEEFFSDAFTPAPAAPAA